MYHRKKRENVVVNALSRNYEEVSLFSLSLHISDWLAESLKAWWAHEFVG